MHMHLRIYRFNDIKIEFCRESTYSNFISLDPWINCADSFVKWQANSNMFLGWTFHANLMKSAEYMHSALKWIMRLADTKIITNQRSCCRKSWLDLCWNQQWQRSEYPNWQLCIQSITMLITSRTLNFICLPGPQKCYKCIVFNWSFAQLYLNNLQY